MPDFPNVTPQLAFRFRSAWRAVGLTSERAAELLGVSRQYISQIENNKRDNIALAILLRASMLFGCSPSYLLGLELPAYEEMYYALYVRGLVSDEFCQRAFDLVDTECRKIGFDPTTFMRSLGLEWTPAQPSSPLAPGITMPKPIDMGDMPKTLEEYADLD